MGNVSKRQQPEYIYVNYGVREIILINKIYWCNFFSPFKSIYLNYMPFIAISNVSYLKNMNEKNVINTNKINTLVHFKTF